MGKSNEKLWQVKQNFPVNRNNWIDKFSGLKRKFRVNSFKKSVSDTLREGGLKRKPPSPYAHRVYMYTLYMENYSYCFCKKRQELNMQHSHIQTDLT